MKMSSNLNSSKNSDCAAETDDWADVNVDENDSFCFLEGDDVGTKNDELSSSSSVTDQQQLKQIRKMFAKMEMKNQIANVQLENRALKAELNHAMLMLERNTLEAKVSKMEQEQLKNNQDTEKQKNTDQLLQQQTAALCAKIEELERKQTEKHEKFDEHLSKIEQHLGAILSKIAALEQQQNKSADNSNAIILNDQNSNSAQNIAEIFKTCEQLFNANDVVKLTKLINEMPLEVQENGTMRELVLMARALINFKAENFKEMYAILESHKFSAEHHLQLQQMWWDAHYQEMERIRGRPLGPVGKYRERKRNQLPATICDWDQQKTYCFTAITRKKLMESYMSDPNPNPAKREQLAQETGLTPMQVASWCKNRRWRELEAANKMENESLESAGHH